MSTDHPYTRPMMRIINKLATQSLIPSDIGSNILDFTVPVIDNFGDMGVALSLAFELLTTYPNIQIRFFSEDEVLFEKFIGRSHSLLTDWYGEVGILTRLSYHSLDSYI